MATPQFVALNIHMKEAALEGAALVLSPRLFRIPARGPRGVLVRVQV